MANAVNINLSDVINNLVVHEARRWVGVTERGGNNVGQIVEIFQKAVDGQAVKEPWCMAFVQSCIINALRQFEIAHPQVKGIMANALFASEHCVTVFNKTDVRCRSIKPTVGSIVIWKNKNNSNGHTGIVAEVKPDGSFITIEGNTDADTGLNREGNGVFQKLRSNRGYGDMQLLGFIEPWLLNKTASPA
jgi:CHAP domain